MLLATIIPLWFSSVLLPVIPATYSIAETPQANKEEVRIKDTTVIISEPDAVYGYSCVRLVRRYRPDAPSVNASDYPVSTTTVSVGSIGKMVYHSTVWHVFYVLEVHEDTLRIVDSNYDTGYVTVRVIPRHDPRIVGYL